MFILSCVIVILMFDIAILDVVILDIVILELQRSDLCFGGNAFILSCQLQRASNTIANSHAIDWKKDREERGGIFGARKCDSGALFVELEQARKAWRCITPETINH